MVVIECPNCQQPIQLVDLRPGRFIPRCPHCSGEFELSVADDVTESPQVARVETGVTPETAFTLLRFPEPPEEPSSPEITNVVTNALWRVIDKAKALRPRPLPKGVPRFLDGPHHVVLRQDGSSCYGPTFLAVPWTGGFRRTVWFLPPELAHDPYCASRWVDEMIVAAEANHPNLDPYESIGESRGSFPFVAAKGGQEGTPATEFLSTAPSSEIRQAWSRAIILQAARGLKYAHALGVYHRDLRAENLTLTSSGSVRILNFGLAPHALLTDAETQRQSAIAARNLKEVKGGQAPLPPIDHRAEIDADLAALGRTWIALATNRTDATTMTADSLDRAIESLPKSGAAIVRKLVGMPAENRFTEVGQATDALEGALGIWSPGIVSRRDSLQSQTRKAAESLNHAPNMRLREMILLIAGGCWGVLLLLSLLIRAWPLGLNFLVLGLMTIAWIAAIAEPSRRSWLAALILESIRISPLALQGIGLIFAIGFLVGSILSGYLGTWIFFGLVSLGLALGLEIGVGRGATFEWREATRPVDRLVATLRFSGIREEVLRDWFDSARVPRLDRLRQSLFEPVGLSARLGQEAPTAPAVGAIWSSALRSIGSSISRILIDRILAERDRRHRRLVVKAETDRLEARGVNRATAIRRARRAGKAVSTVISDWRLTRGWGAASTISLRTDLKKTLRDQVSQAIDDPERMLVEHERQPNWLIRRANNVFRTALGKPVRLATGLVLLAFFGIWLDREGIVTRGQVVDAGSQASQAVNRAIENRDVGELRGIRIPLPKEIRHLWNTWNEPLIHREWSRSLSGFNIGLAGLLLCVSVFFERFSVGLFACLGAIVMLIGPVLAGAEPGDALTRNTSAAWSVAGIVVAAIGLLIPRKPQEV